MHLHFANANESLLSPNVFHFLKKKKKSKVSLIRNGIVGICMHFNIMLPTAVRAEHWLRPDSDECPGLPRWDVPSSQAPTSYRGPVRVEAYSRAHHPQGPGQGGLQRHINIAFRAAALNRNFDFSSLCSFMFLFVCTSAVNLPKSPTDLKCKVNIWLGPETVSTCAPFLLI